MKYNFDFKSVIKVSNRLNYFNVRMSFLVCTWDEFDSVAIRQLMADWVLSSMPETNPFSLSSFFREVSHGFLNGKPG